MNLQTLHSGPNQIQNPSASLYAPSVDPEFVQIRKLVQEKIWEFLMQRCRQSHEVPYCKLVDVLKRLEEGLFRSASTKEEYMNLATVEQRLLVLIKRPSMINHNQQLSNASQSVGTDHFSEMQNQFQHKSLEEHFGASLLLSHPSGPQDVSSSSTTLNPQQFGGNPQNDFAGLPDSIKPDDIHDRLIGQSNNTTREKQFKNHQKWLLLLRHARRCPAPEGKCLESNCLTVQKLLKHMEHCNCFECAYPRCRSTRVLVNHHKRCRDESCPLCIPVKNFVQAQRN